MRYFLFLFFIGISVLSQNTPPDFKGNSTLFEQKTNELIYLLKKNNFKTFKTKIDSLFKTTNGNKNHTQLLHYHLGNFYKKKHISDSAYYHYNLSKNILLKKGDSITASIRLFKIAEIQHKANDYLGSEINTVLALRYIDKTNLFIDKAQLYNLLGNIYSDRKEPQESIKHYDVCLDYLSKSKKQYISNELMILNNKGVALQRVKKNKEAILFFKKGLKYDDIKYKFPKQYSLLVENIAWSNFSLKKFDYVLKQYNEALKINTSIGYLEGVIRNHINISHFYKETNNFYKAKEHAKTALKLTNNTHFKKEELLALELLAELSPKKEATQYFKTYVNKKDIAIQKERKLKNQFAKVRYETEKKEKENTLLKTDNEQKQAEIVYQKQQKAIGWLVAASILLLLAFSISFFVFRRKRLLFQTQLQKAEAREHERQQIAKSLHDEVAGDLRLIHQKLASSNLIEEANKLDVVKENVRNLSHQLSSVSFDKVSFKDQIVNLVSDYFDFDFRIKINGLQDYDWKTIDNPIKRLLYLSIRESIQNSKKYAEASLVTVDFTLNKKTVFLSITDNGIGFDTTTSKKGIGLHNLQERVEELNGTFNIESEIGKGTKTSIQIPLNA